MKIQETSICLLIFLVISLNFASAITANIGNARMILYPEVGFFGTTLEKSILVKNVNDYPITISLVPVDDIESFTKILDNNFVLEPGEEKDARFTMAIKKPGTYEGKINVFFKEVNSTKAGAALSSTIIIIAKEDSENETTNNGSIINLIKNTTNSPTKIILSISTLILIIVLVILFVVSRKSKRKLNKRKRSVRSV